MATETSNPNMGLIAEKCNVSKMTVSRVLRNMPNVSEATREAVLRTSEQLGYMPSGSERRDTANSVKHYTILFQKEYSVKDAYFSEVILSVQHELFSRGFGCSFSIISEKYADFVKLNNILRSREISGIFAVGDTPLSYMEILQTNFKNVILIDSPAGPGIDRPYNIVCTDNVYGGRLAMRHLWSLGRRRILLVCGKRGHYFSNDLLAAYRSSVEDYGLENDPELIAYADFHVSGGYQAAKQALASGIRFDAVFSNDEMACGVLRALREEGLRVPDDISVVGFDGLPIGEMSNPSLTTIAVDRERMGMVAVQRLIDTGRGVADLVEPEKISLFPKLLIRDSCGARMLNDQGGHNDGESGL